MRTRRQFLRDSASAAGFSLFGSYGSVLANAQSSATDDYKAIVCIFLFGGNDSNNVLVPIDATGYGLYASGRAGLAIPQSQLLPLGNSAFAVNPNMPEVQSLYNSGSLAFIANMGTLVQPVTKAQYLESSVPLPQNLLSHPDQVAIMQTSAPTSNISQGWGGGIVDAVTPLYGTSTLPSGISYYGAATFVNGAKSNGLTAPSVGGNIPCADGIACGPMTTAVQEILACPSSITLVQADLSVNVDIYSMNSIYAKATAQVTPLNPQLTGFAGGLMQAARLIEARNVIGAKRQVFFMGLGSFDTHANQPAYHASLLAQLSSGLGVFSQTLQNLGLDDKVTTFTLSDFSRTLQPNSSLGTDHAWGGHHMVMGGAVKGGKIYGTFPTLELGGPDDLTTDTGRWLPTTSVGQVGATLASWFGVPDSALASIFPGLANFTSPKLAFL